MQERTKKMSELSCPQSAVINELRNLADRGRRGQNVASARRKKRNELETLKDVYTALRGY